MEAAGRVLSADVTSSVDVPHFARGMMDGYALRGVDTLGASEYNRLTLEVIGEALPGRAFAGLVGVDEAVRIMTGAPLPSGADSVLPVEQVEAHGSQIFAMGEVSPGKNIARVGEDVACGSVVLTAGRRLRPQDVGVLSLIGVAQVPVVHRPKVRIVVTGSELLPPGTPPEGFRFADANGPMLEALVHRDGGVPHNPGIVRDDADAILAALRDEADVVLVSGGSSVGQEDLAPMLIAEHGELPIHGLAMRPSSPAGMGILDGRLVFLLPGNPVSCLCAYDFFAGRAIRALGGRSRDWHYRRIKLPLRRKLVSVVGRVDYARVKMIEGQIEPLSISGAAVLSSTTRADGFVIVPGDSEGYPAGAEVEMMLYDNVM
jgi:molybdopterin molybdotransferase